MQTNAHVGTPDAGAVRVSRRARGPAVRALGTICKAEPDFTFMSLPIELLLGGGPLASVKPRKKRA